MSRPPTAPSDRPTAASISLRRQELGQLHFRQRAEHRPVSGWAGVHRHARSRQRGELFDRVDFKLSAGDTVNLNFSFTRSWFQTPNSYDAQNATAWSGLVVDNGGLGPNGQVVGSQDQRSKIRTFNIAPTWTQLINANTVFTFGGFVRQDQYNYYPSARPLRRPHARSSAPDRRPESQADQCSAPAPVCRT